MNYVKLIIVYCAVLSSSVFSQEIIINEIMSSNSSTISDDDGDYSDWIEIYNCGKSSVNLKGYGLSDSKKNPLKWVFPDVKLSSGAYLLVWASDKNKNLHTSFKIGASGESVVLALPDGTVIDEFPETSLQTDISCGRKPGNNKEWFFFTVPTPGKKNITAENVGILEPPKFTTAPGIYGTPVTLYRPQCGENVIVRYTLDGSEPTESSPVFEDSLYLTDRSDLDNDVADIPTNRLNYLSCFWKQPPKVAKGTVIRMAAFCEGFVTSQIVTGTFFIFDKGVNRYSLPIVSIVTDKNNFFSDEIGIYVAGNKFSSSTDYSGNYWQRGDNWEREGNIEFFDKNGTRLLSQGVGYRMHGEGSRPYPLKTFKIYARSEYGNEYINYPFFDNKPFYKFKRLLLRNSGNDFFSTMFRDGIAQRMVSHLEFDTQGFVPYVVFINGEYWGIQNLRERFDKYYIQRVYGIESGNLDQVSLKRDFVVEVSDGDSLYYKQMLNFVQNNDMKDEQNYKILKAYLDVDNFLDYIAANIYLQNTDWLNNNIDFWRARKPYEPGASKGLDGRFRMLMYDVDFAFGAVGQHPDMIAFIKERNYPLLTHLLSNNSFKTDFINRQADLMNSAFAVHRAIPMVDSIYNVFEPEIEEHIQRWGYPESKDNWRANVDEMKKIIRVRPGQVLSHLINHFQLLGTPEVTIENDISKGYVKINSLILNESLPGVNRGVYPWTGTYLKGNPVRLQALCKDGFKLEKWIINDIEYTDRVIEIDPGDRLIVKTVYGVGTEPPIEEDPPVIPPPKENLSADSVVFKNAIVEVCPNKLREKMAIKFTMSQCNNIKLNVYDINGKLMVRILNEYLCSGEHLVFLNSANLKSGIYLCVLRTGNSVSAKKIQILR